MGGKSRLSGNHGSGSIPLRGEPRMVCFLGDKEDNIVLGSLCPGELSPMSLLDTVSWQAPQPQLWGLSLGAGLHPKIIMEDDVQILITEIKNSIPRGLFGS